MRRAPSSRSRTSRGRGAWKGGGMVWLTTKVCTVPRRARCTSVRSLPPHPTQAGWIDGGVEMVPHAAAARPGEAEHLGVAPHEGRSAGGDAHGDGLPGGHQRAPDPQGLDVGGGSPRPQVLDAPGPGHGPLRLEHHGGGPAPAVADHAHPSRGARPVALPAQACTSPSSGAAAPVSPTARDSGAEATGAPNRLPTAGGQLAVGVRQPTPSPAGRPRPPPRRPRRGGG